MADQESGEKKSGWFKAFVGTITGLLSGAAVMYLTPLVNKAIQPAKPLANFKVDHTGLTVHVQDLSNVHQGHWDFGDGSPLVPVSSDTDLIEHTYPGPGEYTIKLSLQNLLNDENERSVVVKLEETAAAPVTPHITRFDAVPAGTNTFAPAAFRLSGEMQNAQTCVLELGDGRKMVMQHPSATMDRTVTFDQAKTYVIKMVAINGSQHEEKQVEVKVTQAPAGVAMAMLTVNDSGTQVQTGVKQVYLNVPFPRDQKGNVYSFKDAKVAVATPNRSIAEVQVSFKDKELKANGTAELDLTPLGLKTGRNLKLRLSPDRQTVFLSGDVVRENNSLAPSLVIPAALVEQHPEAAAPSTSCASAPLSLSGSGLPSATVLSFPTLSRNLTNAKRELAQVELRDGTGAVLWRTATLPSSGQVMIQGRATVVSAAKVSDQQVQIQLSPVSPPVSTRPGPTQ